MEFKGGMRLYTDDRLKWKDSNYICTNDGWNRAAKGISKRKKMRRKIDGGGGSGWAHPV